MRKNKTKAKLQAGETVFGSWVGIPSPTVVEILGYVGLDFVTFDCEHMPMNFQMVEDMIRAAEVADMTPLVRVANNDRQEIVRYLDRGAQGIFVPWISTKADAEAAVRAVKYTPEGMRGIFYGRGMKYSASLEDRIQYHADANRETMIIAGVETPQGVENISEIASVKGIDVIYTCTGDLSQQLGLPGQLLHPTMQGVVDRCTSLIVAGGKVAGYHALNVSDFLSKGGRYISAVDTGLLRQGVQNYLKGAFDLVR